MNWLRTFTPTVWLIILALLLALVTLGTCQVLKLAQGDASRADATATLADAGRAAAGDASGIRDRSDQRTAETTTIVQEATDEIRSAPDRNAAADATRRRVCQLTDYRDPQCAMFRPDPRRVD